MATAQDVINRARELINDAPSAFVSGVRWTDTELLRWITDAQREVVKHKPEAYPLTKIFIVTGGSPRQRLDPTMAYRLIRVEANGAAGTDPGEDVAPVLTVVITEGVPELTWTAAEFASSAAVAEYEIFGVGALTWPGSPNFGGSPTAAEVLANGTLIATVDELTYLDEESTNYLNEQYAYFVRAISAGADIDLDSNVYTTQAPS